MNFSLITSDVVLTAAHCMDFGEERNFLQRIVVKLGDHDITQVENIVTLALFYSYTQLKFLSTRLHESHF